MGNISEREMINAIAKKRKVEHELEIFDKVMPAIKAALRAGGGADAVLRKSETIAAMTLIESTRSDKPEVRLKAAEAILNRTLGKPVERSINVYGDISKMNERDLDQQIVQLLQGTEAKKLLTTTLDLPKKKRLQKRKPRKSEPLVLEATIVRPGDVEGTVTSAEARPPSES